MKSSIYKIKSAAIYLSHEINGRPYDMVAKFELFLCPMNSKEFFIIFIGKFVCQIENQ